MFRVTGDVYDLRSVVQLAAQEGQTKTKGGRWSLRRAYLMGHIRRYQPGGVSATQVPKLGSALYHHRLSSFYLVYFCCGARSALAAGDHCDNRD